MARRTRRHLAILAAVSVGAVGVVFLAGPASAHVRVFADGPVPGRPATLQFRIPGEKADATTVRVEIELPPGLDVTDVPPVAGWQEVTSARPAEGTRLTWTATAGHAIPPDDHQYFDVRVGPLPLTPTLRFRALQAYSDGSFVAWDQDPTGGTEPPFPAPVLTLRTSGAPTGGAATRPAPSGSATAPPPVPGAPHNGSAVSRAAIGLGGVLTTTAVLVLARLRRRSGPGSAVARGTDA